MISNTKNPRIPFKFVTSPYYMVDLQDWADMNFGIDEGVDFIAMSFVNDADVVCNLKDYISTKSSK